MNSFAELMKEHKMTIKKLKVEKQKKAKKQAEKPKKQTEKPKKGCEQCGYVKPIKVKEELEDVEFKCGLCNIKFATKELLKNHKINDKEHNLRDNIKKQISDVRLPELIKIEQLIL